MRKPLILIALLAPCLSGCVTRAIPWADLQLTSPTDGVRVEVAGRACLTPCTLRFLAGHKVRIVARDPQGFTDFIYEVGLVQGDNELDVLAGPY